MSITSDSDRPSQLGITVAECDVSSRTTAAQYAPELVQVVDPLVYKEEWNRAREAAKTSEHQGSVENAFNDLQHLASPKFVAQARWDVLSELSNLRTSFPNFAAFIDAICGECSRALLRPSRALNGQRFLLVGPPGIGKTKVAKAVAQALRLPYEEFRVSSEPGSFEISGSGRHWAQSAPGAIAKFFARSTYANPVILLDEVDKGPDVPGTYGRSLDVLLQLTETDTAKCFRDNCLQVDIDTHRAFIIATANDSTQLPEAFLSRFISLTVEAPSRSQMPAVVNAIYLDEVGQDKDLFSPGLPPEVAAKLVGLSPRRAKLVLHQAVNRAAMRSVVFSEKAPSLAPPMELHHTAPQWCAALIIVNP